MKTIFLIGILGVLGYIFARLLRRLESLLPRRAEISAPEIALDKVAKVQFYKLDELTTDLICCELTLDDGGTLFLHEEMHGWDDQMGRLATLPGFDADWFAKVAFPPFATCHTIAFERA